MLTVLENSPVFVNYVLVKWSGGSWKSELCSESHGPEMARGFLGHSENLCLSHELPMQLCHLSVRLGQEREVLFCSVGQALMATVLQLCCA